MPSIPGDKIEFPSRVAESRSARYAFDVPCEQVTSATIRGFDAYWRGKSAQGRLPSRDDIDPAEIKPLLPHIILLNVEWDPFRCRVRLRGTQVETLRPKGKHQYLDQATTYDPGRREDFIAEMKFVATQQRPAFARDYLTTSYGVVRDIWAGIWPLSSDGARVDMLVVIEDLAGTDQETPD